MNPELGPSMQLEQLKSDIIHYLKEIFSISQGYAEMYAEYAQLDRANINFSGTPSEIAQRVVKAAVREQKLEKLISFVITEHGNQMRAKNMNYNGIRLPNIITQNIILPDNYSLTDQEDSVTEIEMPVDCELLGEMTYLYPTPSECRMISHDAGISIPSGIVISGSANEFWTNIIVLAKEQNKIPDLIRRALRDYSHRSILVDKLKVWQEGTE